MLGQVGKLLIAGVLVYGTWSRFADRPVHPADGELAAAEPHQWQVDSPQPVTLGRWTLTPRAHYEITARILGRENYRFDALSDLSAEDLALGWGPMSDNRVVDHVDISQSGRFYFWKTSPAAGLDPLVIATHSANTHIIANDGLVARQLASLRVGQVVHLQGDLVDGTREDGRWIRTSLVRTDTGAGACEVFLVRDVEIR